MGVKAFGVVQIRTKGDQSDALARFTAALPELLRLLPGVFISIGDTVRNKSLP